MIARAVLGRASGADSSARFHGAVAYARAQTLAEGRADEDAGGAVASSSAATTAGSARLFARSPTGGAFLCAKLDPVYQRYLLATDTKACVSLFDCAAARHSSSSSPSSSVVVKQWIPQPSRDKSATPSLYQDIAIPAHTAAITVCSWYPADCNLFLTGGMDSRVLAWETERFLPAFAWQMEGDSCPVYCLDIRSSSSPLAAVGSAEMRVRLLDLRTCALTHSLLGHTEAVMTVQWLNSNENLLVSGSKDGTVRLWDVRKSGASAQLAVFDRNSLTHSVTNLNLTTTTTTNSGGAAPRSFLAQQTTNPSASSTVTGSLAHSGGVNCLVALDSPLVGEYGGAGEPSPTPHFLLGRDSGSGGGTQTGDRSAAFNGSASTATGVPPKQLLGAVNAGSGLGAGSTSSSSTLSWAQAAKEAEQKRVAGSLMATDADDQQSALASIARAMGQQEEAAKRLLKSMAVQKPAPFALRAHLFSSGWDSRPQCWDLILASTSPSNHNGSGAVTNDGSDNAGSRPEWRKNPAVSAGLGVPFSSLAEVGLSVACTGVSPGLPVKNPGRRCIFPAIARIAGSGPVLAPSADLYAGRATSTVPVALPSPDLVVFMPSTEVVDMGAAATAAGGSGAGGGGRRRAAAGSAAASAALSAVSAQGVILALEVATGRVLNTLRGHQNGPVNACCYREEAQELYSAGTDGCILLWSSPLLRFGGADGSPDGDDGSGDGGHGEGMNSSGLGLGFGLGIGAGGAGLPSQVMEDGIMPRVHILPPDAASEP